ncbi:MAG: NAD+ synthase [Thermoplasmata archaeon]
MTAWVPKLPPHAIPAIHQFLRAHALSGSAHGLVLGLSGGVDSALTARLARDALGPERVLGVLLPEARFPSALRTETEEYARTLGIESVTIPIDPVERAFGALLPEVRDRVTVGNTSTRIRMTVLHALARERGRLVAGTGNKSELLLGYFTKYGDGGVDLLPIGDLYKTEVWEAAAILQLPPAIRERAPTAGLWEGQTDEGELGLPYSEIDRILYGIERLRTEEEIADATQLPLARVHEVAERVARSRHKRRPAPVAKVGFRTVGIDWRE